MSPSGRKLQKPSSKLQINTKLQGPNPKLQAPDNDPTPKSESPKVCAPFWSLKPGAYLEHGVWSSELSCRRQMRSRFQPFPEQLVKFLTRRLAPDAIDDLAGKRMNQHAFRGFQSDAPCPQVINRVIVQLAYRGAVRAFDVIGVDLQLRL